jgi:tetraacyldisaccharide 4'-kinase
LAIKAPQWWWLQEGHGLPLLVWPAWPALRLGEVCYRRVIAARNASYDKRRERGKLFVPPVPTISVGNISVGGSGKTPLTIWLAGMLRIKGRKPAIVARGYGAGPSGLNDELQMAARKCPYAAVLANPDRATAIRDAIALYGVDAVILDDAFQHRQVRRNLDIVLVDATRGFGNGRMLPAGPLREPIESLKRANVVLLTRAEQVQPDRLEGLLHQIEAQVEREVPVGRVAFQPSGVMDLGFEPADFPEGPGGAMAGVGNFGSFVSTCRQHGLDIVAQMPLSDHVRYDEAVCQGIEAWAKARCLRWVATTEKDAAKLSQVNRKWGFTIRVLSIRVVPDGPTTGLLERMVGALLASGTSRHFGV